MIVPVTTIVGDNDAEIAAARDMARASLSFYNPAFDTPDRFERYGAVARVISDRTRG